MYCHNCGTRNPTGANFCGACGNTLQPATDSAETTISFMPESGTYETEEVSFPTEEIEEGKAVLVVKKGPEAGTNFFLEKDVVTCGRDAGSDIFLDDVTVSRRHAEIRRENNSFVIVDSDSLNGTFVNRNRVDRAPLRNGDEIQIGKFKLVIFTEGPVDR
ncbi:MAG TPA: FHA domain-containing protein [Actinomycetota bacterium]|jgi:pSer/pThr/pTyr-binding forkhead associated (FHA) protein|nr:FHA domain-containing protein [Actinomycetota bacterium]